MSHDDYTPLPQLSGNDAEAMRRRIDRVEWQQEQVMQRLHEGAAAFEQVRKGLDETNQAVHESHKHLQEQIKPQPVPVWKVASFAFALACMVGGWIWSLARYPDRSEFIKAQEVVEAEQRAVRLEVSKVKVKQINLGNDVHLIRASVERQERTQEKLEAKLDKALEVR